jgi:hypothetical protein
MASRGRGEDKWCGRGGEWRFEGDGFSKLKREWHGEGEMERRRPFR